MFSINKTFSNLKGDSKNTLLSMQHHLLNVKCTQIRLDKFFSFVHSGVAAFLLSTAA